MLLRIILPLSTLIYVTLTFFFFNDTATTEIYTLSLHDALPISFSAPERLLSGPLTLASSGRLLHLQAQIRGELAKLLHHARDRKSTRLNSSHGYISYAVFCLKKKPREHHPPQSAPPVGHTHATP